jgi:RHS repeat-associated protein
MTAEGRLCAMLQGGGGGATGYMYDGMGYRIAKSNLSSFSCDMTTNGFQTNVQSYYVPGPNGEQLEETDGSANLNLNHFNIFLKGKIFATYEGSGYNQTNWHYALTDWVGTKRVQANYSGSNTPEEYCISYAFGDALNCNGSDATEHHFTSKERDVESTLDYFGARYYNSNLGRFMSPDWSNDPDPVPYADLNNPQSLDLYSYVLNNPLTNRDEDGHFQCTCPPDIDYADLQLQIENFFHNLPRATVLVLQEDAQLISNFFGKKKPVAPPVPALPSTANPNPDDKNKKEKETAKSGAQDKKLSHQQIGNLEENTGRTAHEIKEDALGTDKNLSKYDLYENSEGEIVAKPKGSSGTGEPTGYTTEDLKTNREPEE